MAFRLQLPLVAQAVVPEPAVQVLVAAQAGEEARKIIRKAPTIDGVLLDNILIIKVLNIYMYTHNTLVCQVQLQILSTIYFGSFQAIW